MVDVSDRVKRDRGSVRAGTSARDGRDGDMLLPELKGDADTHPTGPRGGHGKRVEQMEARDVGARVVPREWKEEEEGAEVKKEKEVQRSDLLNATEKEECPEVEHLSSQEKQSDVEDKDRLTLLSWNIDGLDPENLLKRLGGLFSTLKKYRPDVILLQELVHPHVVYLQKHFKDYNFLRGNDTGYFTGIMLKRSRVELIQSNIVNYPTTEMGRNLLMANVDFFGQELCVMTSHLESCLRGSQERLNQLRRVWKRMREAPDFRGRYQPEGLGDVWETLGRPDDCAYTWDTTLNDNKGIPHPAQLRFDRLFLRAATGSGPRVTPETMKLLGLNLLKCGWFTSDHWGILCTFTVSPP